MLPKLCHLDNDLEIIIIIYTVSEYEYIYCVVHMTYITYLGTFCSHGTPVWPWPVIHMYAPRWWRFSWVTRREAERAREPAQADELRADQGSPLRPAPFVSRCPLSPPPPRPSPSPTPPGPPLSDTCDAWRQNCDMHEEMRQDCVDLVITASEKYSTNYEVRAS